MPNDKMLDITQFPHNTSLMGAIKGILDYYGIKITNAWLFGGSGHAFLINIHQDLCPSGPYCWDYDKFNSLLGNLGIQAEHIGDYSAENPADERQQLFETIKQSINQGNPCSMLNYDNQIIIGYKDAKIITTQPWPKGHQLPITLTFPEWPEFEREIHVTFDKYQKIEPKPDKDVVKESLDYAIYLGKNAKELAYDKYQMGLNAYKLWIHAIQNGNGKDSHGNWWNGTVWHECRMYAMEYFKEIAVKFGTSVSDQALKISETYKKIADNLQIIANKKTKDRKRIALLQKTYLLESEAIYLIENLLNLI